MSDDELLQKFADPGGASEDAFRILVDRYAGLVFSIALRRVGNRQLAEEIAQNVFTALARKAGQISVTTSLSGWLHRATMFESAKALRGEQRRRRKMEAYQKIEESDQEETPQWSHVLPLLDEALHRLSSKDLDLVLRHYFEGNTYEEIAAASGRTKAACAKQGSRVLDKLCGMLKRQGVTISAAALAAGISTQLATGAPASLAQSLTQTALSAAASTSASTALLTLMTSTKYTTAAMLVAIGTALPLTWQWAGSTHAADSQPVTPERVSAAGTDSAALASASERLEDRPSAGIDLRLLERELRKLPFPDGDVRRRLDLERLMFQLRQEDVPEVVAMLKRLDPDHLGKVTAALFARWGEFAPAIAADAAEEMGDSALVYHAREGVMGTWAASDLASALKYLETHPNGVQQSSMVWATIGDLVDRDPHGTLSLVGEVIADEKVLSNVREIILQAWGETDPDAALGWAGTHDEMLARSFSKAIIERLAIVDPAKAFQLALDSEHRSIRAGSARWTLMQWQWLAPLEAMDAYLNMPAELYEDEQMLRNSVMLSGEVARRDREKAVSAAERLPEGPAKNRWLYGVAWTIASTEPEQAAAIAESLPPSGYRKRALAHIGKMWLSEDAAAGTRWIEESGNFGGQAIDQLLKR